jgi:hypothetical protein
MTVIKESEHIRNVVKEELIRFQSNLVQAGITWSNPEIVISNSNPNEFTAELKIVFFYEEDLIDIFEFFICEDGLMSSNENDVRIWIQENLPDVIQRHLNNYK